MNSAEHLNLIDYAAPEAAFQKYADEVYRLAFVRTGSQSDSDDILQEVFLRYMRVSVFNVGKAFMPSASNV